MRGMRFGPFVLRDFFDGRAATCDSDADEINNL